MNFQTRSGAEGEEMSKSAETALWPGRGNQERKRAE